VVFGRKKQNTSYALVYIVKVLLSLSFKKKVLLSMYFSLTNFKLSREPNKGRETIFFSLLFCYLILKNLIKKLIL
jgi:hypothetical protein